jgi:nucleoside-diphosphate-sugar epimerase
MSHVLVTGASGFLGRAVIEALAADGHVLRAAVRQPPQQLFSDTVQVIRHDDLTRSIDWRPLVAGVDTVIHLAGVAHFGRGTDAAIYDRVNRLATEDLALAAARAGVTRFVFISSVRAQSGPAADHVLTERAPAVPTDAYGRAKLAAEACVKSAGLPFTILRPVLVYGPAVKGNFAALLRLAASPWPLPVKDFANRRSLLDIDNFISALRFVLSVPATNREIYLVADPGIPPTLCDLMRALRQAQDRRPLIVRVPPRGIEMLLRMIGRGDIWQRVGGNLQVDPAKLIAAGWQPLHDTRAGLATLVHKLRAPSLG